MPAEFTIDVEGSVAVAKALHAYPDRVTRASVRALNRGIASARTLMVREIGRDLGMKAADVRDALKMREATPHDLRASLAASLKRIPLVDFKARQTQRGVTYKLPNSRGRIPNAFIATMASGHTGVFLRLGKRRLPIQELHGPSLGHVFEKFRASAEAKARETFEKNLTHEIAFATDDAYAGARQAVGQDA